MDKKEQLVALWKTCFGDSDSFIRLFFDRVYRDENALTLERGGRLCCALHIVPYKMLAGEQELTMAYVCGVATWPEFRRQGLMGRLMRQALEEMTSRGYDLTSLIPATPALFNYYRAFGYQEFFNYSLTSYIASRQPERSDVRIVRAPFGEWILAYDYFDRKVRERACSVLYDRAQFKTILLDHQMSGGDLYMAHDESGKLSGLAFGLPEGQVRELVADTNDIRASLLASIARDKRLHTLQVRGMPLVGSSVCLYGMVHLLRAGLDLSDVRSKAYMNLMLD